MLVSMPTAAAGTPEPPAVRLGPAVLRLEGVRKAFHRGVWPARRSVVVLSGATLEVEPGEMLWDKLTVDEHFALFARAYGMTDEARDRTVAALLDELQFAGYRGYRIEELSGGTRQKLNLALALMHEPQLLLLDEPYAGFDWETYLRFWEMSERRRDAGMGILIVSHLLAERERLDRIYTVRDGKTSDR